MARTLPPIPNLRRLEIAIVVELYSLLAETEDGFVDPDELAGALDGIPAGLIPVFADRARIHGYYHLVDAEEPYYDLLPAGLDLIMDHGADTNSDITSYMTNGVPWILEPDEGGANVMEDIAAQDWEPLPIDRGNEDFGQMVLATEAAIQQIEANNGYAATEPDQRNGIVTALRGAIETIKSGAPSSAYIRAALIAPLTFISKKFAEGIVGQVAKTAADAVIKWLTSL